MRVATDLSLRVEQYKTAGLPIKGKEWIEISAFGQQTRDCGLRAVFELDVFPLQGGK